MLVRSFVHSVIVIPRFQFRWKSPERVLMTIPAPTKGRPVLKFQPYIFSNHLGSFGEPERVALQEPKNQKKAGRLLKWVDVVLLRMPKGSKVPA